ncbi:hypothetical protein VP277E431_P0143 [Vibrio phage 277E43-1]|nr:hypothetical protein VP277E431_P0143 [Vibrio phage 277E43-1]
MAAQKETHTVILENGKEVVIFCETSKRLGYAMEAAAKQNTRVLRIV